jgi:hypothetical protein
MLAAGRWRRTLSHSSTRLLMQGLRHDGRPAKCSEQLRAVWSIQRCSTDGGGERIFSTSSQGAAGFVG